MKLMRTLVPEQNRPSKPASSLPARQSDHEHPVLQSQRTVGNRAVLRMMHTDDGSSGGVVQRQPAPGPNPPAAPPRRRTWAEVRSHLRVAGSSDPQRVPALVQELLQVAEAPGHDLDLLNDAMGIVADLSKQGDTASADRLLSWLHVKFVNAFRENQPLPTGGMLKVGSNVLGDPGALIAVAQDAARAGNHDRAFQIFGVAHEILSLMALNATDKAGGELGNRTRSRHYNQFQGLYGEMREIYRFYFVLEAEALEAGDAQKAAEARDRAAKLHERLKTRNTILPESVTEIGETTRVTTTAGRPALDYHGANYKSTELSELPGHFFPPDVLAAGAGQDTQKLGQLQDTLRAQVGLQAEIAREPEVRKAFGKDPVDLNDNAKRLKVWGIMYRAYKSRGPGALGSLMELMGRYLQAHTWHTSYNVRDFGTSYLDSEMPSDLAGRMVRDCGVYALTVAWDVFQTMKAGDPSLKVSFTLATLLDHIILVVTDDASGDRYLINNDQITKVSQPVPPAAGASAPAAPNLDEEVAKQYALFRSLPYLVSPVNYMELGATTTSAAASFKAGLWTRYLASTQYMSRVRVDFRHLQDFSIASAALDQQVDQLAQSAPDAGAITAWLNTGWPHITSLLVRFAQISPPRVFQDMTPLVPPPTGSRNAGAFRWPGSNHPLLRVALALLRLQKLGQPLTPAQQQYLANFETNYKQLMDKSRQDAEAGRF